MVKRILALSLAVIVSLMGVVIILNQAAHARSLSEDESQKPRLGINVIESSSSRLVLELVIDEFHVEQTSVDGDNCQVLKVEGLGENDQLGRPRLPVKGAMFGIPPGADPLVEVLAAEQVELPENYNICPLTSPTYDQNLHDEFIRKDEQITWDQGVYSSDQIYPGEIAELVSTGFIRSQRVASIRMQPFQYNPQHGKVRFYKRLLVAINFNEDDRLGTEHSTSFINEGSFEELLSNSLLNYDQARQWRQAQRTSVSFDRTSFLEGQPSYNNKIVVDQDGIYKVSYADMQAAGIPAATLDGLDPQTLRLLNGAGEIAIHVQGESDGVLNSDDYLLFYGLKVRSKFTDENIYWLSWGGANGLRMQPVDGTPSGNWPVPDEFKTTVRIEEDHQYVSTQSSGPDKDHWYWDYMGVNIGSPGPLSITYQTLLQNIAAAPVYSATVRGLLKGISASPGHHTRIYLNGSVIADTEWYTASEYMFEVEVSQDGLNEGQNFITVEALRGAGTNDYSYFYVNWFEIDYYDTYNAENDVLLFDVEQSGTSEIHLDGFTSNIIEVFDITEPYAPVSISVRSDGGGSFSFTQTVNQEHTYIALTSDQRLTPVEIFEDTASDLRNTNNGADYIIITPNEFYSQAGPLAAWRSGQGLRVEVVKLQDIFDEFNYGIFDPEAIRMFLSYAYFNWTQPAPAYVLLFGDGNFDFKDNMGWGDPNYIPPYLDEVDFWIGETATDNRYVCVHGDDILPEMHIGRLPVRSALEAEKVVAKILYYEQNPPSEPWNANISFVADYPAINENFPLFSDNIADYFVPSVYTTEKIYYGVTHSLTETQGAIIDAFNQGRLLINYIGHAGVQSWAYPSLFSVDDIPKLSNSDRLPFVVPMSCLNGYFIWPKPPGKDYSSLGESIVRADSKGAIASWSPSGFGLPAGHYYLNRGLYEAIFYNGATQIGPATTQAKMYLYAETSETSIHRDLIHTFILFGDPFIALHVLSPDLEVSKTVETAGSVDPGDLITYTLTYSNVGGGPSTQVVISDTLSSTLINTVVSSSGASITQRPGSRYVWDVEDLSPGEGGMITITAQVDSGFGELIVNTATIAGKEEELQTGNNKDEVNSTVGFTRTFLPIINR